MFKQNVENIIVDTCAHLLQYKIWHSESVIQYMSYCMSHSISTCLGHIVILDQAWVSIGGKDCNFSMWRNCASLYTTPAPKLKIVNVGDKNSKISHQRLKLVIKMFRL